jgi:cytochrome c biogenesis protein CcmG/thiol:disulfide interchange protein DsbE
MGERLGGARAALAVACLLASCGHGNGTAASASQPDRARVGQPAPSWSEPTVGGPTLSLASLHGKAVYLNFFATWCPPCNAEAPSINDLARSYAPRGLQVVGVDVMESPGKAASFRSAHHLIYPVIADGGVLRDQYNVNGLPVHVFIDRSGVVQKIVVGELSPQDMRNNVERMLR